MLKRTMDDAFKFHRESRAISMIDFWKDPYHEFQLHAKSKYAISEIPSSMFFR